MTGNKRQERMITVTDDWYPCFEGNKVRLMVTVIYFYKWHVKISAWGADDTGVGMEYAYDYKNKDDADKKYQELVKYMESIPENIDRQWFYDHGFMPE